jgi:hypothetical protein
MSLRPPRLDHIKLQHPVLRRKMSALANVANLNSSASSAARATQGSSRKPHRIPSALLWQSSASVRVAKIAELPQFLLRRNFTLMSRHTAGPAPPAAERKPARMQESSTLQSRHRHKKRTSHTHPAQNKKCEGLPILLTTPKQAKLSAPNASPSHLVVTSALS